MYIQMRLKKLHFILVPEIQLFNVANINNLEVSNNAIYVTID